MWTKVMSVAVLAGGVVLAGLASAPKSGGCEGGGRCFALTAPISCCTPGADCCDPPQACCGTEKASCCPDGACCPNGPCCGAKAEAMADCCFPASPCCYPGSPCCGGK
jgi:hypothetical protein